MYPVQTGAVQPCQKVVVVIAGLVVLVISGWLLWNQDTLCDLSQQQLVLNVELEAMNEQYVIWQTKLTKTKKRKLLAANKELEEKLARWKMYNDTLRNVFSVSSDYTVESTYRKRYDFFFHRIGLNVTFKDANSKFPPHSWLGLREKEEEDAGKNRVLKRDDIIVWIEGAKMFDGNEFRKAYDNGLNTVLRSQGDRARLVEDTVLVLVMRKKRKNRTKKS